MNRVQEPTEARYMPTSSPDAADWPIRDYSFAVQVLRFKASENHDTADYQLLCVDKNASSPSKQMN